MAADPRKDDQGTTERARRVAAELASRHPDDRSIRTALLERAVDAVDRLAHEVDDQKLRQAIDASTDTAFLAALSELAITAPTDSTEIDPLAAAKKRGEQAKREILAEQGEMLAAEDVASRLGCSMDEVGKRRLQGLLVALPIDTTRWGFPAWQFTEDGLLPGLEEVLRELPVPGPWSRILFLQNGDPYLNGQTPLELIRRGEIDIVRRLAAAYDELVAT